MHTRVQKWGNSLAVRIPKAFASEIGLRPDSAVELSIVDGNVLLVPVATSVITLEALLDGITEHNLHHEVSTGEAVGSEAW